MRIPLTCPKCTKEQGRTYPAELRDDGLYVLKCAFGHQTLTLLQNQNFEVLFELAANAILDGYYREAIISFKSCLERFYEYYLQVMSIKHGVLQDKFRKALKNVYLSERQLGAYIIAFTLETGESPPLLNQKMVELRNNVIHNGKIPTKDEAIKYGQAVRDLVAPAWARLKEDYSEHVIEAVRRHVMTIGRQVQGISGVQTMLITTTLSMSRGKGQPQPSLLDALNRLSMRRNLRPR